MSVQLQRRKSVVKRDGTHQEYNRDKLTQRIDYLSFGLDKNFLKIELIVDKVVSGMYDGVTTADLDNLLAETCAYMNIIHPHYSILAARISVDRLHKETKESFADIISDLYNYVDKTGQRASLIAEDVYQIVQKNAEKIQKAINYDRDFTYDFFGFKTLEKSYLLRLHGKPAERPQHLLMRASIGIHKDDIDGAIETYNLMSEKWFTHATPTLFNAGTPNPQMSSCFLLTMQSDSIDGIYETLKQCALISKSAGGIGLAIHNIRSSASYIKGTNGVSNGIVPMLRVFNDTARYVDQGGGKRKGSFAIYLEPWHSDIFDFLDLKKNHGKEENRARDLFYALWIPDLFMERVEKDEEWTLMCPNECLGLGDVWGDEFNTLYKKYESEGKGRKTIKARNLFMAIVDSQIETGTPYMLYKDQANRKSNQKNLGTIKSSNLCTEIIEYTSPEEIAVCNLASISLPKFVNMQTREFDYEKLIEVVKVATKNLNKIIDGNFYPVPECKNSNLKHRPIGLGVQGLADAFIKMRIAFETEDALKVNEKIFETMYYAAATASMELAQQYGPYTSFQGSPASKGIFQFDMWDFKPRNGYDWEGLKQKVMKHGMRNSLLLAPMPTASTSQIMGNNETFEPYTSNLYTRRVLSGEFVCLNSHLVEDLIAINMWTPEIKNKLISTGGSVQQIDGIPQNLKELYKTVWEISQKKILDLAIGRGPFIDQSQSLNIHLAEPNFSKMSSMHFYAWKNGLKTGMYYLRSRPAVDAIKFTLDVEALLESAGDIHVDKNSNEQEVMVENQKKENITENAKVSRQRDFDDKENSNKQEEEEKINGQDPSKKLKSQNKQTVVCTDEICYSCGS